MADCDVAVVGAGPYGLAVTAHLRSRDGVDVRLFGDPMSFWDQQMPVGMLLRSPYVASSIAAPDGALDLDAYQAATGRTVDVPVPLEQFVDYGRWFQEQIAPDVDRRQVSRVARENGHFRLSVGQAETLTARRVVVAAGVARFTRLPAPWADLPRDVVSHAYAHRDLGAFNSRRVLVLGGGQSALESAALLHEGGAEVEVLVRASRIFYLRRVGRLHRLGPVTWLLFAPAEVGPAGLSRVVSMPSMYRRLPRGLHDRGSIRSLRPAGAAWLRPRLAGVPITTGVAVTAVERTGQGVRVDLDDGTRRTADHVILGTGYRVDLARYDFLSQELLAEVDSVDGCPRLSPAFETSARGLHVVGAAAARTFGPLMRFVAGTEFTAAALARGVVPRRGMPRLR